MMDSSGGSKIAKDGFNNEKDIHAQAASKVFGVSMENVTPELRTKAKAEYISDIRVSGIHLLSMINEILDISKIETGKLEIVEREFDTKVLIKSVIKQIKILAEKKNLKLKTNISSVIPSKLLGDDVRIREILINLLIGHLYQTFFL